MAAEKGAAPLSVTDAVALAKGAVSAWPTLVVNGEVSGFRGPNARSGHCYFEVKDDGASMSVIVWRGTAAKMGFELRDGLSVQLTGKFDVYKASGKLSFVASKVEAAGEGLLRQQVAELARRLEREGLMADERKRRVPVFCSRVCVVTSLSGSVIEDVKRTLARRNPLVEIDVVGCSVQGADAPATIVRALGTAASSRPDAILLVRGGGSFEDLMCFNDESVARAIAGCEVPVVPRDTPAEKVLEMNPDGVFFSNGPGDPVSVPPVVEAVRACLGKLPVFGICLGNQVISMAAGATIEKLPYGHHGGNEPVMNLLTGKVEITAQNHNYGPVFSTFGPLVPELSGGVSEHPADEDLRFWSRAHIAPVVMTEKYGRIRLTHVNLNDGTPEGIQFLDVPAFSMQYHPEAKPGPNDSTYAFSAFAKLMRGEDDYLAIDVREGRRF